jgi:hypothetical protein
MSFAAINDFYTFSATTGTYTPITGTVVTEVTGQDDVLSAAIPLGFSLMYGETSFTEVKISSNGWIGLGTSQTAYNLTNSLASTTIKPVIAPLWDDTDMGLGNVSYLVSGTAPNRVFTVQYTDAQWNYQSTTLFNFQAKIFESGKISFVYGSSTGAPTSPSASIGINMAPGGSGWYYSVTPGAAASASTTAENTTIATFPAQGTTYDFTPVVVGPNDLAATTITGSATPSIGQSTPYTISVRNRGTAAQTTYTVKLFTSANVELGSVAGTAIQPGETLPFIINWTPQALGTVTIYGKATLAGDLNPQNDQTSGLVVSVMDSGVTVVQIGTGTTVNTTSSVPAPYGTFYKNFRQQYLYTAAEINAAGGAPGLISSLAYEVTNVNTCVAMPNYRIRMKSTTQTALTTTFETGDYTTVWTNASFLPVVGWNIHDLTTPFIWDGSSNVLVDILTDLITGDYTQNASTPYSATTFNSALRFQSDTDAASAATTGTTGLNRSNVRFYMTISDMGSLSGTVTAAGTPVAGASVRVLNSVFATTTGANGTYSLPFVPIGLQQVSATKHGYNVVTHSVTIIDDQNSTQDFAIALLPQVIVTGRVVGSDNPTVGIAGATVALSGYEPYSTVTNASGIFTFPAVFASQTYNITATVTGYQTYTGQVVVGTANVNMNDVTVNEIANPASGLVASEAVDFTNVSLSWNAPGAGPTGFNDDFESYSDFAITFAPWTMVDVDLSTTYGFSGITFPNSGVAMAYIIFNPTTCVPALEEAPHSGNKMAACFASETPPNNDWMISPQVTVGGSDVVSFWARTYVADYGLERFKVGVSTTGTAPANFTIISGASYISAPVAWTNYSYSLSAYAGQQVYVGIQCLSNDAFIFFVDDFHIGTPVSMSSNKEVAVNHVGVPRSIVTPNPVRINSTPAIDISQITDNDRTMLGYKVYRLLASDQANETAWTTLTPANITPTTYIDNTWQPLPSGVYKFAVKAAYTNGVLSAPTFSNEIHKGMMGVLTGAVTEFGTNLPVAGATVTAGTYSGTTNTSGVYSFSAYAGTYNVIAAKPGYQPASQAGVVVVGLQTTTQNFVMTELTLPASAVQAAIAGNNVNITWSAPGTGPSGFSDDFESYPDFAITFAPWTLVDVDLSTTYGFSGITFPNSGVAMAYIIFNPTTCVPALEETPHSGNKFAACFASETPPNNDWMISPQVTVMPGDAVNFWARTYVADYGLERFKVGVSTTGTAPANFTIISGASYISAPITWTNYNYDLSAYTGQQVYVGIQCLSNDAFIFFVDDFTIGTPPALNNNVTLTDAQENLTKMNIHTQNIGELNASERKQYNPSTGVVSIQPSIDLSQLVTVDNSRALTGYKVWRLIAGQETNEPAWTSLTTNPISATAYQDTGWGTLPDGTYKWAVKAVYTGGALSIPALSNPLTKISNVGTIAGIVRNQATQPIAGATVVSGSVTATTGTNGAYSMIVPAGTHSVTVSHASYASATQTGIIVLTGQTTTANFILAPTQNLLVDGFETYTNFALTFAPWTLVDVDLAVTGGINGVTFQNSGAAMAYIIFNPSATTPAVTSVVPHGGAKVAASFYSTVPPNNDWLITPQVTNATQIKFWAKSMNATYGLERFKVGVSTTGTAPANFTIISGATYIEAPITWTEYTYNITNGNVPVYIGIQCVSNDAFVFFVDDVTIIGGPSANEDITVPVIATELKSNYPNPFNPETTISFSVKEASPVSIEVFNVKGQLVKTLINDVQEAGNHNVVWNGKDNNGRAVSSGIYYYKMNTGKYSSTKKMIMMK